MPYVRNTPHWKPVLGLLNGGLDMAVNAFYGSETAWHVEYEAAPSKILAHHWPDVPNHGDVTQIDWAQVEPVDVLTGGFPCQDVSAAGRRAGLADGTRSGLWSHMAEAVNQLRPRFVVIENVRGLLSASANRPMESDQNALGDRHSGPVLRALGAVLGDLADLGYDAQWTTLAASDIGACHRRQRVFIIATPAAADRDAIRLQPVAESGRGGEAVTGWDCAETVALLPTPAAADGNGGGRLGSDGHAMPLPGAVVQLLPAQSWGKYGPAIARAERAAARPAPSPTEPNKNGNPRLSATFAEWMMMLPAGWVTDPAIRLSRNDQLKAIGNGVCPPQAYRALEILHHIAFLESAS